MHLYNTYFLKKEQAPAILPVRDFTLRGDTGSCFGIKYSIDYCVYMENFVIRYTIIFGL